MRTDTRHIGILGAGHIAAKMARTLRLMDGRDCLAVASRDGAKARAFAAEHGIARPYGSYRAMMDDPDVELVYVATPHSCHFAQVTECLERGKHVLCEKAFMMNAREAERAIAAAERKGLYLSEAIWTRFMPLSLTLQRLLREGAIGEPRMASANLCYPVSHKERLRRPDLGGGALLDLGVYALHFAAMALGGDEERSVSQCRLTPEGVDEQESVTLLYSGGRMAALQAGITSRSDRRGIVAGTRGYIEVENINNPSVLRVRDTMGELLAEHPAPPQITGLEYEVEASLRAIDQGLTEPPEAPHAETLRVMRQMDRLRAEWGVRFPGD